MLKLNINGQNRSLDVEPDTPLLWALRDELQLTGTKYGCGIAACGACTVLLNGAPARACVTPVSAVVGQRITTIEGLATTKTESKTPKPCKLLGKSWMSCSVVTANQGKSCPQ